MAEHIDLQKYGLAEGKIRCPHPDHEDKNPSASLRPDGSWYCFSCHQQGDFNSLKKYLDLATISEHSQLPPERLNSSTEPVRSFSPSVLDALHEDLILSDAYVNQLQAARKWPDITPIEKWHIGKLGGQYVLPVYTSDGECYSYRLYNPIKKTFSHKTVFGKADQQYLYGENFIKDFTPDKPILFCEGEMDTIMATLYGHQAVSTIGGCGYPSLRSRNRNQIFERWASMLNGFSIVVAYDNDKPGQEGAVNIMAGLIKQNISPAPVHWVPWLNDVSDCLLDNNLRFDQEIQAVRHRISLNNLIITKVITYKDDIYTRYITAALGENIRTMTFRDKEFHSATEWRRKIFDTYGIDCMLEQYKTGSNMWYKFLERVVSNQKTIDRSKTNSSIAKYMGSFKRFIHTLPVTDRLDSALGSYIFHQDDKYYVAWPAFLDHARVSQDHSIDLLTHLETNNYTTRIIRDIAFIDVTKEKRESE